MKATHLEGTSFSFFKVFVGWMCCCQNPIDLLLTIGTVPRPHELLRGLWLFLARYETFTAVLHTALVPSVEQH